MYRKKGFYYYCFYFNVSKGKVIWGYKRGCWLFFFFFLVMEFMDSWNNDYIFSFLGIQVLQYKKDIKIRF